MVGLLFTIILFILKVTGVISWPMWLVNLPLIVTASFSLFLFIKAEFEYMRNYNKNNKEEVQEEQ